MRNDHGFIYSSRRDAAAAVNSTCHFRKDNNYYNRQNGAEVSVEKTEEEETKEPDPPFPTLYIHITNEQRRRQRHSMGSRRYVVVVAAMVVVLATCGEAAKVHVSILNRLGKGRSIGIHCRSKDDDLGPHTIPDGSDYGWDFSVNAFGSTLFCCDLGWEAVPEFHFDAYAYQRDRNRCSSQCSWLLAREGVYGLNGETGLWEFMYPWGG